MNFSFSQESKYHYPDEGLNFEDIHYLFGNNTEFRKAPDTSSKIISVLKIETTLRILNTTLVTLPYHGFKTSFQKLSVNDKDGYIVGELKAREKKSHDSFDYYINYLKADERAYNLLIKDLKDVHYIESILKVRSWKYRN